jgi:TonB family protein
LVVPPFKPLPSGKIPGVVDRDSSSDSSSTRSVSPSDRAVISSLKELIANGGQRLEPILKSITDSARQLTGASGAALAMWKEGAMVCRARSGETAPPLGARLSAATGISGECLRTGQAQNCTDTESDARVDLEVCRSLALRSIAVLPIQGWRGINGIIEVFSTQAGAFTAEHISLLERLAALAERARASQPHGASAVAPKVSSGSEKEQSSGLLPASDRVGDVALAFVDNRSRPFVVGGIGLGAVALLALVIWLPWRGSDDTDGRAHAATPAAAGAVSMNSASPNAATAASFTAHPPDNDPIWRPNPGGESLFQSGGKPSAGSPVKLASSVDIAPSNVPGTVPNGVASAVTKKKTSTERAPLLAGLADKVAVPHPVASSSSELADSGSHALAGDPSSLPAKTTNTNAPNGVLSAAIEEKKTALPEPSVPVSQGVSGGQLVRRIPPVYPAQARQLRLEGTVVLMATVMEDGKVGDVKVVEGASALAQSAVDAVKQWRYKPYQLDGKAVKNEVRINVDFKLPADNALNQ